MPAVVGVSRDTFRRQNPGETPGLAGKMPTLPEREDTFLSLRERIKVSVCGKSVC